MSKFFDIPIYTYELARSANFSAQYLLLSGLQRVLFGSKQLSHIATREIMRALEKEMTQLLKNDAHQIGSGVFPLSVLTPEAPFEHLKRVPRLLVDGLLISLRRSRGKTTEFKKRASELLDELPRYYRRNFHFQTDGYLSRHSAELYEHQVELLFAGTGDAMRRLIIAPMKEAFKNSDGTGLKFLEIGAGAGSATRFVRLCFPKAKIVAVDLSDPYLKHAQKKLAGHYGIDFLCADGAKLPFKDGEFDAVYSVFLFHELPLSARKEMLLEAKRLLKAGGFLGYVDSLQKGDYPIVDPVLENFPEEFHEPYYRNYLNHSMEKLVAECGFKNIKFDRGFLSKVGSAKS